jgi:hypothetical protein
MGALLDINGLMQHIQADRTGQQALQLPQLGAGQRGGGRDARPVAEE